MRAEQNELLTRTGPGTPMGNLFRRYWLPALLAEELPEPDCPPVRVKILGERLIAFRDTQNRFGLIDHALAPFGEGADLAQLKRDLAVTVSAEALFTLTDLCGLGPEEAIASAARTAATLTAAAFSGVRETGPVRD